jgi:hypothetical protein
VTSPFASGPAAAVRFLPSAWRGSWLALLVAGAAVGLLIVAHRIWPSLGPRLGALVFAVATVTMAEASLFRIALARRGAAGLAGLRWGGAETRLLAAWALCAVLLAILFLLFLVTALCVAYAVASAGPGFDASRPATWAPAADPRGKIVLGVLAATGTWLMVWACVRLALAPVATVVRDKVQVLSAWPLTRTLIWPLLAGLVAVGAAPGAAFVWLWRASQSQIDVALAACAALGAGIVLAGLWLPLTVGLTTCLFVWVESASAAGPPPR